MKKAEVRWTRSIEDEQTVGTLVEQGRRVFFEYDSDFLTTGIELSPFHLPLQPGLREHRVRDFGPLPGLFDDSLPDGWGRLLMDRYFRQQGHSPADITALDRLLWLGRRTMGALTYHPCELSNDQSGPLDLAALAAQAERVLSGNAADVLPELLRMGGSPAGARPKILAGVKGDILISGEDELPPGFSHWLIKFAAAQDPFSSGITEYAYSLMAKAAGIRVPVVRLFPVNNQAPVFGVQRFDRREPNRRVHMHTLANLLHADFRVPALDYTDLLKVTQALTRNHTMVLEAFRRMIFNIATHNRDDHGKNFAFTMNDAGEWALSPAYDLVFSDGPGGEHTTTVMGEGKNPGRNHCLAVAETVGIKPAEAMEIIDEVNTAVAEWQVFAAQARCGKSVIADIKHNHRVV